MPGNRLWIWAYLAAAAQACALAPPNDRCQTAQFVDLSALPVQVMGTTLEAADDERSGIAPAGAGGRDVVYRFDLASPTSLVIETAGSAFDSVLSVWGGCDGGSLIAETAANDDFEGIDSRVDLLLLPAGEYFVLVDGFDASQAGVFFLTFRSPSAPTNDVCSAAQPVPLDSTTFGSTLGAVNDSLQVCSSTLTNGPDVFYRITVGEPMDVVVDTLGSALDTVLTIREGVCSGPIVACNDDFESLPQSLAVIENAEPGVPYFIQVDSAASGAGTFRINVHRRTDPPPNDVCSTQLTPVDIPAFFTGSTRFAGDDAGSVLHGGDGPDVVFQVELGESDSVFVDSAGSSFDTILYARQGSCDGPEVAAGDDVLGKRTARLALTSLPSGLYYIFLDGKTTADRGDYVIRFDRGSPPPNDDCETADLVLVPGVRTGSVRLADDSGNVSLPLCSSEGPDVVFRFELSEPRNLLFSTLGSEFDTVLYLLSGTCEMNQVVACNDDGAGSFGVNSYIDDFENSPLAAGDYYLVLDSFEEADGEYTLQIIDLSTPTPIPSATRTPTRTATRTPTPTRTTTRTASATGTPTSTVPPSPSPTLTSTRTPTSTQTAGAPPTTTFSPSPSSTETLTASPTQTDVGAPTPTGTNTPTETSTVPPTPTPTDTERGAPTATESTTPTPTQTPSETLVEQATETPTSSSTESGEPLTPTLTPTISTASPTVTHTPEPGETETPSETVPPAYDLDQNGSVGASDLLLYLAERAETTEKTGPLGDFNRDDSVDGLDLFLFSFQWRNLSEARR